MATEVSQSDIEQAEALLTAFLSELIPNLNLRKGSPLRSLVIAPAAAQYALLRVEGDNLRKSLSLENIDTSGFDESVIESFIENFLVTRNQGSKSSGILKVIVTEAKSYNISTSLVFTKGDLEFSPVSTSVYQVNGSSLGNKDLYFDANLGAYFALVPVESSQVSSAVITANEEFLLSPSSFIDESYDSAESYQDFSVGKDVETLTEFRDRAKNSLTVRDLVTKKSISTVLPEEFPQISDIVVSGYGDVEMVRDLVLPQGVHKGGDVDVYVRTDYLPIEFIVEREVVSNLQVDLVSPDVPVLKINSVHKKESNTLTLLTEGVDYRVEFDSVEKTAFSSNYRKLGHRFSSKEIVRITFLNSSFINSRVVISGDSPSSIATIQTFVDSKDNRVISSSLLVKAMLPVYITLELTYRTKLGSIQPQESTIKQVIMDYFNTLKSPDKPQVSEIVDRISGIEGVEGIQLPLTVTADLHKPDGTKQSFNFSDKLSIPSDKSQGFSQRVCQYVCREESLVLNKVNDE